MAGSSGTAADHSSAIGLCSHRVVAGSPDELVTAIRDGLADIADPAMPADMKSTMPFRGVPTLERRC